MVYLYSVLSPAYRLKILSSPHKLEESYEFIKDYCTERKQKWKNPHIQRSLYRFIPVF
jgi:hypothetical protein